MRILFTSIVMLMLGLVLGGFYGDRLGFNTMSMTGAGPASLADESVEKKPLYWMAPMDKNYRRDKPGLSPMGMDLVPFYEEDPSNEEGAVKISAAVINNIGVRSEIVTRGPLKLPINTVGYVSFDEDQLSHIHSRVDGWIEKLNVTSEGDAVKKGQTLYELYSPTLVNAQEEYLSALRSTNKILVKASRSRLISLGLSKSQVKRLKKRRKVDQLIKVMANSDGFVKELSVRKGMFIKPATRVMSIGSLDTVWVIAEVFERQAHWVKTGLEANMTVGALPSRTWKGKVDYLYPVLNEKTRTLRVRIRFDNSDFTLKPNMYTDISLLAEVSDNALSIPREALIKAGKHTRVVKLINARSSKGQQFKSVFVKSGVEVGARVQILEGLSEGDRVVTSAQFLIDSESNIDAEISRMEERDSSEASSGADDSGLKQVESKGVINQIMTEKMMLDLSHEPIPKLGWPEMKMMFPVDEGINLDGMSVGQTIRFTLQVSADNEFLITEINALNKD